LGASFNQMTGSLRMAQERMESQAERLKDQNQQLEDALQQLATTQAQLLLKAKMASLGDLVAGVAHELNNPTGSIVASTDVTARCADRIETAVRGDADREDLEKLLDVLRRNVRVTTQAGQRIAAIVKSLRSFAHLDEADYQRVDIHDGIEHSLTLLGSEALQGIEVVKRYGDVPMVGCYPGKINQVWLSILRNAVTALDGHGQLVIRSEVVDGNVRLTVTDNGPGIPADRLPRIFDVGFSADGTRVKMGSGLSTAYRIMQEHQGDIVVESTEGEGTSVSVTLPIR